MATSFNSQSSTPQLRTPSNDISNNLTVANGPSSPASDSSYRDPSSFVSQKRHSILFHGIRRKQKRNDIELGYYGPSDQNQCLQALLLATSGKVVDLSNRGDLAQQATVYFEYIQIQIQQYLGQAVVDLLPDSNVEHRQQNQDKVFSIVTEVANHMRLSLRLSINQAVQNLVAKKMFTNDCAAGEKNSTAARQLTFVIFGWITLLYVGVPQWGASQLQIRDIDVGCFENTSQSLDMAKRPFSELLHGYGTVLPSKPEVSIAKGDSLHIGSLNAATLCRTGLVNIQWTTSVSEHLEFQKGKASHTLYLFALPSFCALHQGEDIAFKYLVDHFHDDDNRPQDFSLDGFFGEIILSFQLIFRDVSRARHLYRDEERAKVLNILGGNADAYLDELCGYVNLQESQEVSPTRGTFSKASDFPIFAERLSIIQNHIQAQQPQGLRAMLHEYLR